MTIQTNPEEEQYIETLPIRRMVLKDRAQHYVNMLNHVHDLTPAEREKITEWLRVTEQELNALPKENDEVAFHPEVP